MKSRKGISPLIAVVLLIAFTIAVGAIIGAWVTTFSRGKTGELSEGAEETLNCAGAGLRFDTDDIGTSRVLIRNTGDVNLWEFTITVINESSQNATSYPVDQFNSSTNALTPQQPGAISNSSMSISAGHTVRVVAGNCPNSAFHEVEKE